MKRQKSSWEGPSAAARIRKQQKRDSWSVCDEVKMIFEGYENMTFAKSKYQKQIEKEILQDVSDSILEEHIRKSVEELIR